MKKYAYLFVESDEVIMADNMDELYEIYMRDHNHWYYGTIQRTNMDTGEKAWTGPT